MTSSRVMNVELFDSHVVEDSTELLEAFQDLRREVESLRQEVSDLRRENAELRCENATLRRQNLELRQNAGFWKSQHARAVERIGKLEAEKSSSCGARTVNSKPACLARRVSSQLRQIAPITFRVKSMKTVPRRNRVVNGKVALDRNDDATIICRWSMS